jgi:hypothetical protein
MAKVLEVNAAHKCRAFFQFLAVTALLSGVPLRGQADPLSFPEPQQLELKDELGHGVQRFMKRLEASTAEHKNTVRVLYYGQSITEQTWTKMVSADLRQRWPNVNFVIENRAIGGFASDKLVLTSESDLYPFYADLVIFYDYGRHDRYEDMVRRMRERTTSEIILQTDHLNNAGNLTEETDPARLNMSNWSSWFPNVWIPSLAVKYQTGMVQQRALWKIYCRQNNLDPVNLTVDGTHLNDQGNFLMSKMVSAYLVRRPQYDDPVVEHQVRDYIPDQDLKWTGNKLVFHFTGNKIDAIARLGATGAADVRIDGKKPSELPELYQTSRVSGYPGIGWPVISRIEHHVPLVLEDWTATATDFSQDGKHFKFSVSGSMTGPDGEGNSDETFISKSGRVVIEPDDWNMAYSFGLMQGPWAKDKSKPPFVLPTQIVATWKVVPFFTDTYSTPAIADPTVETPVILAQGLSNGPHELQLVGHEGPVQLRALRVYQPPLAYAVPSQDNTPGAVQNVPTFAAPIQKTGEVKTQ